MLSDGIPSAAILSSPSANNSAVLDAPTCDIPSKRSRVDRLPSILLDPDGTPYIAPGFEHCDDKAREVALILAASGDPGLFVQAKSIVRCGLLFRTLWRCEDGHMEFYRACHCRMPLCPHNCSDAGSRLYQYQRRRQATFIQMVTGPAMWLKLFLDYDSASDVASVLVTRKLALDTAFDRWREKYKSYLSGHGFTVTYIVNPTSRKIGISAYCQGQRLPLNWLRDSWRDAAEQPASAFMEYSKTSEESHKLMRNSFGGLEQCAKSLSASNLAELIKAFHGQGNMVRTLGSFRGLSDEAIEARDEIELSTEEEELSLDDPRLDLPAVPKGTYHCLKPGCHKPLIRVAPGDPFYKPVLESTIFRRTQKPAEVTGDIGWVFQNWPSSFKGERAEWQANPLYDPERHDDAAF